jgi:hypothetical protein
MNDRKSAIFVEGTVIGGVHTGGPPNVTQSIETILSSFRKSNLISQDLTYAS